MKRTTFTFLTAILCTGVLIPVAIAQSDYGDGTETQTSSEDNPKFDGTEPKKIKCKNDCTGEVKEFEGDEYGSAPTCPEGWKPADGVESIRYTFGIGTTTYLGRDSFVAQEQSRRVPAFRHYNPPTTDESPFASSLASEWEERNIRPVVIGLVTDSITAETFTPSALELYGDNAGSAWVKRDAQGALRQVLSDQYLTDITTSGGQIVIENYLRSEIGALNPTTGLYALPSGSEPPVRRIVISRPTPAGLDTVDILETDYSSSATSPKVTGRRWVRAGSEPNATWTLSRHNGAPASTPVYFSDELVRQDLGGGLMQRTRTIRKADTANNLIVTSSTREKYRDLGNGTLRIVERIAAPGTPEELTTAYTYSDATGTGSVGVNGVIIAPDPNAPINQLTGARLLSLQRSDGYWEQYTYQHNSGTKIMLTEKWSSWKNAAFGDKANARHTSIILEEGSRTVIEKIGGQIVSNEYETLTVAEDGTRTLRTEKKTGTDTAPLITEHAYFPDTAAEPFKGRIQYTRHPDGTLTRYTYSHVPDVTNPSLTAVKTVTERGAVDAAQFAPAATGPVPPLTQGTLTETHTNTFERVILEKTTDIASGLVLSQAQAVTVDDVGRPTHLIHNADPDDYETFVFACCGVQTHRGRDGSVTEYTRDAAGRPTITTVTLGSKTTTTYHVYGSETLDGRELPKTSIHRTITAGSESTGSLLISENIENLRSQTVLTRSPDVNGDDIPETTTHAYDVAARTRSVTGPDGVTRTSISYADGQTHTSVSTYDSAAISPLTTYDYTPHNLNGGGIKTSVQLSADSQTLKTEIQFSDLTGRAFRAESSGHDGATLVSEIAFDERGRVTGVTSTGQPATLNVLNLLGETTESWIDANGDNEFNDTAVGGVKDRVTLIASDYVTEDDRVCRRTRQWVRDDSDTDILVSTSFRSADRLYQKSVPLGGSVTTQVSTKPLNGNSSTSQASSLPSGMLTATTTSTLGTDGKITFVTETKDAATTTITTQTEIRDLQGRTISIHDGRTPATTFSNFTAAGTARITTRGDGTSSTITLDPAGRVTQTETRDASNTLIATVHSTYHPNGQIAANWGTNTNPTYKLYDLQGRLIELRTYRSGDLTLAPTAATPDYDATTWQYEPATGLLLAKRHADNKGPDYTYTADGKMLTRIWARTVGGNPLVTTYFYNDTGELTATTYSDTTPNVSLTHDRLGRQVSQSNGIATTKYIYHPTTLALDTETISYDLNGDNIVDFTRTLDRSRDAIGRDTGWQLKNGTTVENEVQYQYDAAGRLQTVAAASSGSFQYSYLANSPNLIATVTGPAHTVENTWEGNRDVLALKQNKVGTMVISSYEYIVNALGQRTSVEQTGAAFSSSRDIAWTYDVLGQVTGADSSIPAHNRSYQYDAIGNRKKSADSLTLPGADNYTSNALNQYTAVDTHNPSYDADGNATAYPVPAHLTANSTLIWDAENRLIQVQVGTSGPLVRYQYDAQSRRIATTIGGTTTVFLYDGWNLIAEYQESVGVPPALSKTYTWGTDLSGTLQGAGGVGGILLITDHSALITHHFSTYDGNGNVSEYLDETGAVAAHYEYDPFGRTAVASGAKANDFAHRFSTKLLDEATGLYYYGYRYYNPVTGGWSSRDPIEERGGIMLYAFLGNNPVVKTDTLGLCWGNARAIWHYETKGGDISLSKTGCEPIVFKNFKNQRDDWKKISEKSASAKLVALECGQREIINGSDTTSAHSGVFWIGGWSLKRTYRCIIEKTENCAKCSYICGLFYEMNDKFEDPLDFDNSKGKPNADFWVDWETGFPFTVSYTWKDFFRGP